MTDEEYENTRTYLTVKYGTPMKALRLLNNTLPKDFTDEHRLINRWMRELFKRAKTPAHD